ncbi:MAG TPA: glycosyltransferase, partial [Dehalococcoidia bacterium]|nr:glycosyltransferase [Dehalococcoidia bacterium]
MRVCLISAEYPPLVGGVADHTRHLARSLAAVGVEVAVLTGRPGASGEMGDAHETRPAVEAEGFRVLAAISSWDFGLFGEVRRALGCLRPDIAHIQYQTAAYG